MSPFIIILLLLCSRPNRPCYGSCPSVHLSVCLSRTAS